MAPAATVLVPTHNHGRLLGPAVRSALAQTIEDIEIMIVGDGATEETVETARELERSDHRVRFLPNPKGDHHGEASRHAALAQATAPIVCYLSDDDLWFPEHVEYLATLLKENDFAHTLGVFVLPDETVHVYAGNLGQPWWLDFVAEKGNFIPLQSAGHTLELYRRLPFGWRPGPLEIWSDVYMWRQILAVPGCRVVSGTWPTALHLTSARRRELNPDERLAEIEAWSRRVSDPILREGIRRDVFAALATQLATAVGRERHLDQESAATTSRNSAHVDDLKQVIDEMRARAAHAEGQVQVVRGTLTWKVRGVTLRLPLIGPLLRMVGRARSRRSAR